MGIFLPVRVIGLICSVYVTRALSPEIFTVIATAMAVYGITERLTSMNLLAHLVRTDQLRELSLQVAFSCEVARGVILTTIILIAGYLISIHSADPRSGNALMILSLSFLINGFRNPKLVKLRREGKFLRYGICEFSPALAFALFSVLFVWLKPDYASLMWTTVVANLMGIIVGYIIAPWKPLFKFDYQEALPMIRLGIILFVGGLTTFLRDQSPVWTLIFFTGAEGDELGFFNRGAAFSWVLGIQLVTMQWRVLLPQFAALVNKAENALPLLRRLQATMFIVFLGVSTVVLFYGTNTLIWAIGAKWEPIGDLWLLLSLAAGIAIISAPAECYLQAARHEKITVRVYAVMLLIHFPLVVILYQEQGLIGIGVAYLVSQVLQSITFWYLANIRLRIAQNLSSPSSA